MKRLLIAISIAAVLLGVGVCDAQETAAFQTPNSVVVALYDAVTFPAGETPDWDHVRAMFIPEAVIVLRTSWEATSVFSLDGFVGDFVRFIEQAGVAEKGFSEKIVRKRSMVFGDIAHVLVLYEAHITGSPRPPQQGVDSIHLVQRDGRWWIASIVNEIPTAERPLPAEVGE
ncbi:MAG: nuclear transport factor 2 family protein [Candidatus Krumholzibacteria bacterium]|nr:nuclear transport factor 2 family protein [Candidatus Krumholzibacteria bacterium]